MRFDFTSYIFVIKSLRRKKMRSFLTSLGIIIGISSVVIIMSVGKGAESLVVNQIEGIGSDLIAVLPGAADDEGPPASVMGIIITTLADDDTKTIIERVPEIEIAASYLRGVAAVTWQNKTDDTSFLGITANYLEVESTETIKGRFINQEEEDQNAKVVVLGYSVAEELFGINNPLGERVKINKESFRVI